MPFKTMFVDGILNKPCKMCGGAITVEDAVYTNYRPARLCRNCYKIRHNEYENKRRDPKISKDRYLRCKYDLSLEKYTEILISQNGICAICGEINPDGKALHVDHNHDTGQVRGLLCFNCNRMLGSCKEDKNILVKSIDYLIKWEKDNAV